MQNKLKKILAERKISIYRLAKDIGANYADIHGGINGKREMFPKYRQKISEYLGMDEKDIFEEE